MFVNRLKLPLLFSFHFILDTISLFERKHENLKKKNFLNKFTFEVSLFCEQVRNEIKSHQKAVTYNM